MIHQSTKYKRGQSRTLMAFARRSASGVDHFEDVKAEVDWYLKLIYVCLELLKRVERRKIDFITFVVVYN
jgi:hypothetical protein